MALGETIALMAFTEAVRKYDENRGNFLGFAKLVIESRLKTYFGKKRKEAPEISLEATQEEGMDLAEEKKEETEPLEESEKPEED